MVQLAFAATLAMCMCSPCVRAMATGDAKAVEAPNERKVNVLVLVGWQMKIDPTLEKQLAAEDIHFVLRKISEPLSLEMLKQFHVVMIADWEGSRVEVFFPRSGPEKFLTTERNLLVLRDYIEEGGGFFFTPVFGTERGAVEITRFLKPYGAALLSGQVRDDAHAYSNLTPEKPEDAFDYAWTTDIAKHPATAGVSRIFYPTGQMRWDDMYSTTAVKLEDKAWQPIVQAMESSVVAKAHGYTKWISQGGKKPPIAAVRNVGEGRMALFMSYPYFSFWKPYEIPKRGWIKESRTGKIDGIFLEKGDGTHKSDGKQLLTGLLRWLAEGARKNGMGGYEKASFAALPVPASVPAPAWLYSWKPDDGNRWFQVMVGARSAYSDGSGTVAEYADAARKAGVSVLYMTETLEHFDAAKWPEFLKACAEASNDQLKVVGGLDMADLHGNRYLLLGSSVFPSSDLLSEDGKAIAKPHYLCLGFPQAITVQHRPAGSSVPHELFKHFHGMSVYTYKNGVLEDNGLPAYQWQTFRFSNPLPFIVHETFSPADLGNAAATGHQMLVSADTLDNLMWYLGEHGISHFWESPLRMQVTAGPRITAWGGAKASQPGQESVKNATSFTIESDEPIKEVRLMENFTVYRRWTPGTKSFSVNDVKLPEEHVNWMQIWAVDAKGRTLVSPGMLFGRQVSHTWRCGDRQNWWSFPNIYTGTDLSQLDIRVPAFGTDEGSGQFPQRKGPRRGENLGAILDFSFASPAVYIQDAELERYPWATWEEAAYDAKPANRMALGRIFGAHVRYHQFWLSDGKNPGKNDYWPHLKEVEITLRRPTEPVGEIFPIITTLDAKHAQVRGDMSWSYVDASGKEVSGELTKGYVDLPRGGRVGGFIALTDGIRVGANGLVGFAAPKDVMGAMPVGTRWRAAFATVAPDQVDVWRRLMGVHGEIPYKISVRQGKLESRAYVTEFQAENYGVAGSVEKAMDPGLLNGLVGGLVNKDGEARGPAIPDARLPVYVSGVNINWPAAVIRGGRLEPVDVFEGKARARLDMAKAGDFYIGNTITATDANLRIGVLKWDDGGIRLEINNPTNAPITAIVRTVPAAVGLCPLEREITIPPGSSDTIVASKP